ncbi:MAG: sigma-70 family RNA polymerase sigma factor [Candidatus Dormibacteraeota bacterium]|nr:sigma-70 family RNA polymerase sigma factor [Candidatus Dormibacteraeota bacterium]
MATAAVGFARDVSAACETVPVTTIGSPASLGAAADDVDLAQRARTDPDAFGELYDRYVSDIYRFVYSRLHNREAAEDVTSEVFFKALRAIDRYRPTGRPFRGWLYRIAANAVTDHLRARRPAVDLDSVGHEAQGGQAVDEEVVNRTEVARVWEAVDQLNEAQRTAIVLKLGQDMHTADIAACMGRSEGAVKLLIHRGLTVVRNRLEDPAPEGGTV